MLLTLVGCTICGKNVREETESWNSLVAAWQSWFSKSTLKSPSRKTDWFSISFLGLYQGWFSCIVVYLLQMTQVIFIAIVYIIDWKFIFYNSSFGYSSNTEVNWCWIKEIFKAFYAFGKETCINMKDGKIFFAMQFIQSLNFINIIILNVSNVNCFTYDGKNSWLKSLIKFSGGFNSKHVSVEFRSLTQLDGLSLKFTMRDLFFCISKR